MDVEEDPFFTKKSGVTITPTIFLYRNGEIKDGENDQLLGAHSEEEVLQWIDTRCNGGPPSSLDELGTMDGHGAH